MSARLPGLWIKIRTQSLANQKCYPTDHAVRWPKCLKSVIRQHYVFPRTSYKLLIDTDNFRPRYNAPQTGHPFGRRLNQEALGGTPRMLGAAGWGGGLDELQMSFVARHDRQKESSLTPRELDAFLTMSKTNAIHCPTQHFNVTLCYIFRSAWNM